MKKYTLEAAPAAGAKELKNQKAAKAKRIVMAADVHLRSYQAARKIDNGAIGAVGNFGSQEELLLYVEKHLPATPTTPTCPTKPTSMIE
jgi:hypothetical protein